jgi:hypothetical protein
VAEAALLLGRACRMASDPSKDDWVKIYELQKRANEEMEARKVVKRKQAQRTVRTHLDSQMQVSEQRSHKSKEVKVLEGEKERLEYEQWVADERKAFQMRQSKVLEQKAARDVQIQARKARKAQDEARRREEEAEEMMKIKAEIQRAKEEALAKKRAEKERLMRVFEDVAEQKRQKEIEKLKIAEEDKRAAKLYEEMVNKAEEARSSYFIRKVSDNESMAKALDEVFGKRDRERAAKEKATLERIVKEEDERLKCVAAWRRARTHPIRTACRPPSTPSLLSEANLEFGCRSLDERKQSNRRMATQERLATLRAQVAEKEARQERERMEEQRAAADMLKMAEKASRAHEEKLAEKQRKMMEYKRSLELQIREREKQAAFPMTEVERKINGEIVALARGEKPLDGKAMARFTTPI